MSNKEEKKEAINIEVWEDLVNIKDLMLCMLICSVTALGGYLVAPNESQKPLLFGLVGIVIGFLICSVLVKPKRTLRYEDEES